MGNPVSFEVRDGVGVITVDRPPVNAIDSEVRAGIVESIDQANAREDVQAVVLTCAGRTFMSGADLGELGSEIKEPNYHVTLERLEASPKPVVAALFGTALGGGLETAMACHYRVAAKDARVGMPEINLGIIPGAGGTQRLPRLVGAREALDLLVQGAPITAQRAEELGLIDEVIEGDLLQGAIVFAKARASRQGPRRTSEQPVADAGVFDDGAVEAVLGKAARALKGRTTQHELVKVIKAAAEKPFREGLALEKKLSDATLHSPEGKALVHAFFAEREVARIPGLPTGLKPQPIRKAAVIGAGTMGGGITMAFADAGVPVTLVDVKPEALERGLKTIRGAYEASVKRGRLTDEQLEQRMALISGAASAEQARDVDVVVEAVFENMELKKKVLAELDRITGPDTVLATNTSTLSITELGAATSRPDKVVGLHFFVPANVMRLLEIVRGEKTSAETIVTGLDVAKKLRKVGVVVGDGFGFVGNRMMLDGYFRETEQLLLEGATPEQIDRVAEAFGFAMGPNRVNDMAGIDVGTRTREELLKRESRADPYHVVSDALTPMGRIGQKSGSGIYRYEPGDRTPRPDPEVTALVERLAAERGIERRAISDQEVQERLVLPLINIGAQILDEGLAYRAGDIDVIWTAGYGFPRWRGGPMHYGDSLGLKQVLERVEHYHRTLGDYWKPADLLKRLAQSGRSFADYDAEPR